MYRVFNRLFFYRADQPDNILSELADVFYRFENDSTPHEQLTLEAYRLVGRIIDLAIRFGLKGNLWHQFLAWYIAVSENQFSLACERSEAPAQLAGLARADLKRVQSLFSFDFDQLEQELSISCFSGLKSFTTGDTAGIMPKARPAAGQVSDGEGSPVPDNIADSTDPAGSINQFQLIGRRIAVLAGQLAMAPSSEDFYDYVVSFYQTYGCGLIGLGRAFRVEDSAGLSEYDDFSLITPVTQLSLVRFGDLIGYQSQKQRLMDNTEAFLHARRSNNLLLHGDSGTGKSTCIRALINQYADHGLRVIEIYKHQLPQLARLITLLSTRNYRFILYMDDLSFEDFETDFKYLKALIEGGLAAQPDNILIYATSNRRHLIRETWSDRSDTGRTDSNDIHHSDTAEEKISLVNRFGVTIYFPRPDQQQYLEIVRGLAAQYPQINLPEDLLVEEARRWGIWHGNISGRRARQFINHLLGETGSANSK